MLALGAEVVVVGPRGERRIPIASFFTGPFATALGADEILVEVRVPVPARTTRSGSLAARVGVSRDCLRQVLRLGGVQLTETLEESSRLMEVPHLHVGLSEVLERLGIGGP